MSSLLVELEQKEILTSEAVSDIRRYIAAKFPSMPAKERARVFADAVNRVVDKHIPALPDEQKLKLKGNLFRDAFNRPVFKLDKSQVFIAALDVAADEADTGYYREMASWLGGSLGYELDENSVASLIIRVQRLRDEIPGYGIADALNAVEEGLMEEFNVPALTPEEAIIEDAVKKEVVAEAETAEESDIDSEATTGELKAVREAEATGMPEADRAAENTEKLEADSKVETTRKSEAYRDAEATAEIKADIEAEAAGVHVAGREFESVGMPEIYLEADAIGESESNREAEATGGLEADREVKAGREAVTVAEFEYGNIGAIIEASADNKVGLAVEKFSDIIIEPVMDDTGVNGHSESNEPIAIQIPDACEQSLKKMERRKIKPHIGKVLVAAGFTGLVLSSLLDFNIFISTGARNEAVNADTDVFALTDFLESPERHVYVNPYVMDFNTGNSNDNATGLWTGKKTLKATAYDLSIQSCGKLPDDPGYGITASGVKASKGRTIAVDPAVIPLGTKVYITFPEEYGHMNGVYIAEDTGRLVKGLHIDIFFGEDRQGEREVYKKAMKFGVRYVEVEILGT